jgi:hypothetical protein
MPIPNLDYFSIFQDEGEPYYNLIHTLNQNDFNQWVVENFTLVGSYNSFGEVAPNNDDIQKFREKGYNHIGSQCHYSSKAVTLLDEKYEYWTGFVIRESLFYHCITHSFNLTDNRVVDFSRLENDFSVMIEDIDPDDFFNSNSTFPHLYYGLQIPLDFIENYRSATFEENSMIPLLYEWYVENISE